MKQTETSKGIQDKDFSLGTLVMTRGVNDRTADDESFTRFVMKSIRRHSRRDWGDLPDEDKQANDRALRRREGRLEGRLFSAYKCVEGPPRIWIITEHDESVTTVLFPDEY